MNRDKVTFAANIPTQVILDGPGELQPSKNFTDEYRYFLQNGRIMWVPPEVHEQIIDSGATDGDQLTIERSKRGKDAATWIVRSTNDARDARDDARGHGYSNERAPQPPPVQPAQPYDQPRMERTAQGWTQRAAAQAPPPQRQQPQQAALLASDAPELATTPADRMAQALKDAIDLVRGAKQYEPELSWNAGDVRAIAATLFIGGGK